jgi:hypothetical protein
MNSNKTYKFVINGTSVPCRKSVCDEEKLSKYKTVDIRRVLTNYNQGGDPRLRFYSEKQAITTLRTCDKIMAKGDSISDIAKQLPYDYVETSEITESPQWKIAKIWRDHNVKHHTIWGYRELTLLDFGYDAKGNLSSIQTVTNDGSLVSISGHQDLYEDFLQNYNLIEENK